MVYRREFINARNLREEAKQKLKDYDAIMGKVKLDYEKSLLSQETLDAQRRHGWGGEA